MRAELLSGDAGVRIRPYKLTDMLGVARVFQQARREVSNWASGSSAFKTSNPGIALVSEQGGGITGILVGRQVVDEAEIFAVAVLPEQRRRGIGSALLLKALSEFRVRGVARVFLEVRESNINAIAFYKKHGFSETGRRKAYYDDPEEDAVLMAKQLNPNESR